MRRIKLWFERDRVGDGGRVGRQPAVGGVERSKRAGGRESAERKRSGGRDQRCHARFLERWRAYRCCKLNRQRKRRDDRTHQSGRLCEHEDSLGEVSRNEHAPLFRMGGKERFVSGERNVERARGWEDSHGRDTAYDRQRKPEGNREREHHIGDALHGAIVSACVRREGYTRRMLASGSDARPNLAATVAPLSADAEPLTVREAIAWLSTIGLRGAQLSATDPATRPRELSTSARRDLRSTLARNEIVCSGIDFLIPAAHYSDPAYVSRAFDAFVGAIGLAADLGGAPVTSSLPADASHELRAAVAAEASRLGVSVLLPIDPSNASACPDEPFAASVDCARVLAEGGRPEELVARLGAHLGGVRVVDQLRSGLRGPILEPGEARLDVLALRMAIEVAAASAGFRGIPVLDARQWPEPRAGIAASRARWADLR